MFHTLLFCFILSPPLTLKYSKPYANSSFKQAHYFAETKSRPMCAHGIILAYICVQYEPKFNDIALTDRHDITVSDTCWEFTKDRVGVEAGPAT